MYCIKTARNTLECGRLSGNSYIQFGDWQRLLGDSYTLWRLPETPETARYHLETARDWLDTARDSVAKTTKESLDTARLSGDIFESCRDSRETATYS